MAQFFEVTFERDIIPVHCVFQQRNEMMPLILVVQEIFGFYEHIQDVCRWFAKMGCITSAPNLYQSRICNIHSNPEHIYPVVSQVQEQ